MRRATFSRRRRETRPDVDALDAQIQFRLGRWLDGESTMQRVLADATSRQDRPREAVALNDLGMARLHRTASTKRCRGSNGCSISPQADGSSVYAKALNNTGACLMRLGQFERALAVQRQAVEMHERGSRAGFEQALAPLGSTYLEQNDVEGALPYLNRALAIAIDADQKNDAASGRAISPRRTAVHRADGTRANVLTIRHGV